MEDYRLFYKFLNTGSKFHNLEDTLVDVKIIVKELIGTGY